MQVDYKKIDIACPDVSDYLQHDDIDCRRLWLIGEIELGDLGIAQSILRYNYHDQDIPIEQRRPIILYIDSPGGLLSVSYTIANTILTSATPVIAVNMGACDSGAAFIYACAKKRACFPHVSFLFHLGTGGTCGTYQQTKAMQADYNFRIENMKDLIFNGLGLTDREEFDKLIDGEWCLYTDDTDPNSQHNAARYNLINCELNLQNLSVE